MKGEVKYSRKRKEKETYSDQLQQHEKRPGSSALQVRGKQTEETVMEINDKEKTPGNEGEPCPTTSTHSFDKPGKEGGPTLKGGRDDGGRKGDSNQLHVIQQKTGAKREETGKVK